MFVFQLKMQGAPARLSDEANKILEKLGTQLTLLSITSSGTASLGREIELKLQSLAKNSPEQLAAFKKFAKNGFESEAASSILDGIEDAVKNYRLETKGASRPIDDKQTIAYCANLVEFVIGYSDKYKYMEPSTMLSLHMADDTFNGDEFARAIKDFNAGWKTALANALKNADVKSEGMQSGMGAYYTEMLKTTPQKVGQASLGPDMDKKIAEWQKIISKFTF